MFFFSKPPNPPSLRLDRCKDDGAPPSAGRAAAMLYLEDYLESESYVGSAAGGARPEGEGERRESEAEAPPLSPPPPPLFMAAASAAASD